MNFSSWLQQAGLNEDTIQSLQTSNYNSMYECMYFVDGNDHNIIIMYREALKKCHNDDINTIAVTLNIQTLQKLKLKSALRQFHENESDKHALISNEEQNAIYDLTNLSDEIQKSVDNIGADQDNYSNKLSLFEQRIEDEFDLLISRLNERKQKIKEELRRIVKDKERSFDEKKQKYQSQRDEINKAKSTCHQMLNEAIGVEQLQQRKQKIFKITADTKQKYNECKQREIYHGPSEITHFFDILSKPTLHAINTMDIIVKSIKNPKILSVTNNGKNHLILLNWFVDRPPDEQIKIEWYKATETEMLSEKDVEKDVYDWRYTLVKNGNMSFSLNAKQNGNYLCRLSYFDVYLKENLMSNRMAISIECHVLWDMKMSGNRIDFIGNRAKLQSNCWNTLFGKEIILRNVDKLKYHYRLKIHHACDRGGGFMIGIIPNTKVSAEMTRSFSRYGGIGLNKGGLLFPGGKRYTNVTWRDGDIVDAFIDMKKMTLSFAYNGINLGVAFRNIPNKKYRFALTLLYEDDEVELIDLEANK